MRRILVVDDDAHVGQAIGLWLEHNGFACPPPTVDPSGLAALDNANFDLMIVDVFFPGMRGFEAIRLFHQRAPSVPLVVIPVPPFRNGMVPLPIFSPGCDRAWRDARPAPAIQARDPAWRHRRMPCRGRTASATDRSPRGSCRNPVGPRDGRPCRADRRGRLVRWADATIRMVGGQIIRVDRNSHIRAKGGLRAAGFGLRQTFNWRFAATSGGYGANSRGGR